MELKKNKKMQEQQNQILLQRNQILILQSHLQQPSYVNYEFVPYPLPLARNQPAIEMIFVLCNTVHFLYKATTMVGVHLESILCSQ
jgi:hypothetical protein